MLGWTAVKQRGPIGLLCLVTTVWVFPYSLRAQEAKTSTPGLNLILNSLERAEQQNPALSRSYQVTREYKVFRGEESKPSSELTAQISYSPPGTETFKIIEAHGDRRGEKFVRTLLKQDVESAKRGHKNDISPLNYHFTFLRKENFGLIPEYVLHIVPKRKGKGLFLGDIWVNAKTFRIRQLVGVPIKSPSFWITDIHVIVQFGAFNGMWVPVSLDAIATVRFLGLYTLTAVDVGPQIGAANAPNP